MKNDFKKTIRSKLKILKNPIFRIALSAVLLVSAILLEHFNLGVLSIIIYILSLLTAGLDVFINAVKGIFRGDLLDEKFLMSIASIGAIILGDYKEGVAVMLFFLVGETFEKTAVRRSRKSIKSLMDICPDEATIIRDGKEETVDAEDVEVGETVIIRPGERVPLDCRIINGSTDIDTSSMTGESIPRSVAVGDTLDSGVVVLDGVITCEVLRPLTESAASRVLALVENATENKSKEENFITKFSHYYTPIVVGLAVLVAFVPPIFNLLPLAESVKRALTFLVISCPCALVISVPMAFFCGIGSAASRGILYKGGNVFSKVASLGTVAFDKTGTLTSGEFSITQVHPNGISESELIRLAASAEYASNHPLALALKSYAKGAAVQPTEAREIAGEGVIAKVDGREIAVGNAKLMSRLGVIGAFGDGVFVSDGKSFLGSVVLGDSIKPEGAKAISRIKALGVKKCIILSGDKKENVDKIKSALSLDEAYAELKPEDKYEKLERIIEASDGSVGYVGDGINDAPTLARADVGFAMGAIGSDSAVEAADAVIMSDNLEKIAESIIIARKTIRISWQNIIFAIGVKVIVMVLGALGLANMWLAVFADVGVSVIAILNSMRALSFKE